MAFTKTINYTQNVPVSLDFNNYLTGAAAQIRFNFGDPSGDANMGSIDFGVTTGITKLDTGRSPDELINNDIYISGSLNDLNACLNSATFVNHYYEAENLSQDYLSLNRILPADHRGEMEVMIAPGAVHGLSIGSICRIEGAGRFLVTRVQSDAFGTRLWIIYRATYQLNDNYYNSDRNTAAIGKQLRTDGNVNISPIIDISFANPRGQFVIPVTIFNSSGVSIDTGTITFIGSPFVAEPVFVTNPADTYSTSTLELPYTLTNFGSISQANNNYQSVQILLKLYENDPLYSGNTYTGSDIAQLQTLGNAIDTKAKTNAAVYIQNNTDFLFNKVQVDDRVSSTPTSGVVRWHFYGTPAECNVALSKIGFYRHMNPKDVNAELRVVNGRTRIYNSRGK